MGSPRDNRPANWAKTVKRLRRAMTELREQGCEVVEPVGFETPPHLRIAKPSTGK